MPTKNIFSVDAGTVAQGIVLRGDTPYTATIFVDTPENLLGFRNAATFACNNEGGQRVDYYEIGYFMECLYEGDITAFELLFTPDEFITHQCHESQILRDASQDLISNELVDRLYWAGDGMVHEITSTPMRYGFRRVDDKDYEGIGYDPVKAYECLSYLHKSKAVREDRTIRLSDLKVKYLQSVLDGQLTLPTVLKAIGELKDELNRTRENSDLPSNPPKNFLQDLVLDIRGLKNPV